MVASDLPPACCACGVDDAALRQRLKGPSKLQNPRPSKLLLTQQPLALSRGGLVLGLPQTHQLSKICAKCLAAHKRMEERRACLQRSAEGKRAAKELGESLAPGRLKELWKMMSSRFGRTEAQKQHAAEEPQRMRDRAIGQPHFGVNGVNGVNVASLCCRLG